MGVIVSQKRAKGGCRVKVVCSAGDASGSNDIIEVRRR